LLASGSEDKTVKLWDVASGRELRTLCGHSSFVLSVAFSPDGRILASGSWDGTVKLWDVASGRELRTLSGHSSFVLSVAFSPDGRILASASDDKTVKLWDVASGRELRTLSGHSSAVLSVAFSPDGRMLASGSGDKTVKLGFGSTVPKRNDAQTRLPLGEADMKACRHNLDKLGKSDQVLFRLLAAGYGEGFPVPMLEKVD
jgi:WD40 repeat protein